MFLTRQALPIFSDKTETIRVHKAGPGTQAYLARALVRKGRDVVVIAPGRKELEEIRAVLRVLEGQRPERADAAGFLDDEWLTFPPCPPEFGLGGGNARAAWGARWAALFALSGGRRPRGVLLTADNLLPRWPAKSVIRDYFIMIERGGEFPPQDILERAARMGYERVQVVTRPGETAVRGDILDIWAPGYDDPMRLEFFGETIEDLRLFDPMTQRSRKDILEAVIVPVAPLICDEAGLAAAREMHKGLWTTGDLPKDARQHLDSALERGLPACPPGLYYPDATYLEDWLPREATYVLPSSGQLRPRLEEAEWAWSDFLTKRQEETGYRWPKPRIVRTASMAREAFLSQRQVLFEDLVLGVERQGVDLAETGYKEFGDLFWKPEARHKPWNTLVQSLRDWRESRPQTILAFNSRRAREKFLRLAEAEGLSFATEYADDRKGLFALTGPLAGGMELTWNGVLILGEDVLQPTRTERKESRREAFTGLKSFERIETGDLLVHRDYGLGRFGGLTRLRLGDIANDYLLLIYADDDKLYLPVDRLNMVQLFKGPEGTDPSLDRLGGTLWKKTQDRARKAIEQIAAELVEMYAYRRIAKGFAYGPVNESYLEFEASFGFEETPDQAKAIADVLEDMERPEPMDRLVCGDVGFGKTEVAMRAAFRAVMDGKQVILLCPTTVLAEQHYQTFRARMADFPINVGMLSRFVPTVKQKAVLEDARKGRVDILIGTHRLLSKDVDLPGLGLLILDEEQRFGVKHKEAIKQFRKKIDVLTLTATPIPRTLQLSLSGLRGLSLIETPPEDRKPVASALIEREDAVLKDIVARELERGGQVFWVHNRVRGLDEVEAYVAKLAPGARIGRAHGQMAEKALEETMHKFWHKELDILVATAIIESGLDFPDANTLIVDQAQMFGLGQLYQLRGRVGRSDKQAFAYFVVRSLDAMPELARKRLQVILDLDYLGAGFAVAMEDLRLRGAGNILGEVQTGHIGKVGLDLFLEMLEQEVRRLKGEPPTEDTEPELNIGFAANIPEGYIVDSRERLRYYKLLSSCRDERGAAELAAEIKDRFGPLPRELENFMAVLDLKRLLGKLQAAKADLYPTKILVTWDGEVRAFTPAALVQWTERRKDRARLLPPSRLELRTMEVRPVREALLEMTAELSTLTVSEAKR